MSRELSPEPVKARATVTDADENGKRWQLVLCVAGGLLMAFAGLVVIITVLGAGKTQVVEDKSIDKVTTTTTVTDGQVPAGLAASVFGAGALLLVAGAFYYRISKITLPGGGGIELSAAKVEQIAKDAATKATEVVAAQPGTVSSSKAADLTSASIDFALQAAALQGAGVALPVVIRSLGFNTDEVSNMLPGVDLMAQGADWKPANLGVVLAAASDPSTIDLAGGGLRELA